MRVRRKLVGGAGGEWRAGGALRGDLRSAERRGQETLAERVNAKREIAVTEKRQNEANLLIVLAIATLPHWDLARIKAESSGMVQKRVTAQGGWSRRPKGDAPRSEASALGARWLLPARPQPPSRASRRRHREAQAGNPNLLSIPDNSAWLNLPWLNLLSADLLAGWG